MQIGRYAVSEGFSFETAEMFDPLTGAWRVLPPFGAARSNMCAVELRDHRLLVIGGDDGNNPPDVIFGGTVYDPTTDAWTITGPMVPDPSYPAQPGEVTRAACCLLADGRVLVSGGLHFYLGSYTTFHEYGQLYDPASNTWSLAGKADVTVGARMRHDLIALYDGRVLSVGGLNGGSDIQVPAELWDPATFTWARFTAPSVGFCPGVVQLADGRILYCGGSTGPYTGVSYAGGWIFDPRTYRAVFTAPMPEGRVGHKLTLLANGKVLLSGGATGLLDDGTWGWNNAKARSISYLYDPVADAWSQSENYMNLTGRFAHGTHYDPSQGTQGYVYAFGGNGQTGPLDTSEYYDVGTDTWANGVALNQPRGTFAAFPTPRDEGRQTAVLVARHGALESARVEPIEVAGLMGTGGLLSLGVPEGVVQIEGGWRMAAAPVVAKIVVAPGPWLRVAATAQVQLTPVGFDQFGRLHPDPGTVLWASEDEGICTVDSFGLVTGVAAGDTAVTATINSVMGFVYITVI